MVVEFTHVQTLHVLAGCYRGRDISERELLTHLVFLNGNVSVRTGCAVPLDSLVDEYSDPEGLDKRPTCPKCAAKWDKIRSAG